jgi:hypothetical protein
MSKIKEFEQAHSNMSAAAYTLAELFAALNYAAPKNKGAAALLQLLENSEQPFIPRYSDDPDCNPLEVSNRFIRYVRAAVEIHNEFAHTQNRRIDFLYDVALELEKEK